MVDLELVKNTFGNLLKLMKIDKNGFSSRKRNRITLKEKKLVNLIFRNCKKLDKPFLEIAFFRFITQCLPPPIEIVEGTWVRSKIGKILPHYGFTRFSCYS
jgi:hypothetical protein